MGNKSSKGDDGVDDHDRAVLDLKHARDSLRQTQKRLEVSMARETEIARAMLKRGNKPAALMCIKKKKLQQALYDKTHGQLDNVQSMLDSIDFAKLNVQVFESLKAGKNALEDLNSVMSVDDVEKLMDENAEQMQIAQEIDDAVQQHMGGLSAQDEADIEAEYAQLLELEDLEVGPLPDAPTKVPQAGTPDKAATTTASKGQENKKEAVLA